MVICETKMITLLWTNKDLLDIYPKNYSKICNTQVETNSSPIGEPPFFFHI
jgi:hypothetical protein